MSDETSGRAGEAVEVEAKVLETDLADPTEYDRWIAGIREEVQGQLSNFGPHEITSVDDYKQSGRERKAAKAIIAKWDGRRKEATARYRKLLSDIKADVDAALQPLYDADAGYMAARIEWERLAVDSRTQEVAAWYAETQGDVARLVPFETIWQRYAHDEKWDKYGSNLVAIEGEVAEIAEHVIARDLETIAGMGYEPRDAEALRAEYLRTLDLEGSCRRVQALREQRDRMAEVERRRRERMAAEAPRPATDAPTGPRDAASAPERPAPGKAPTAAGAAPQADAGRPVGAAAAPGRVMVFRVTVPEERAREFVAAMRAIPGVHGGPWHGEGRGE